MSRGRVGGYAALPLAYDEDEAARNVELGALYLLPLSAGPAIVLRGGLMLGTAADDLDGYTTNFFTIVPRLTDLAAIASETTWLRPAASPLHRSGNLFVRADVGVDVAVDHPDGSDADPLLRLDVGGGFTNGAIAVAAEIVTVGTLGDVEDDEDRFLHTFGMSLRGLGCGVQGFGAIVVPVEGYDFDVGFALLGGITAPLPG